MTGFARLLAKSSATPDTPRPWEELVGHLTVVTELAYVLAERHGDRYLGSLGLDPCAFGPRLRRALPRAGLAHDWGKASGSFQRMLRGGKSEPAQPIRHEFLSIWLLLHFAELRDWLFRDYDANLTYAILVAIAGHHLRLQDGTDLSIREQAGGLELEMLIGHADFHRALESGGKLLGLPTPPKLANARIDLVDADRFDIIMRSWLRDASGWWRMASADERRFVAALKALLVAADVAGSAVPKMSASPAAWASNTLSRVCTSADLDRVSAKRLGGRSLRSFQRDVQSSPARVTFVRAGCGSGKTVAAYLWAARHGGGRKLFFCYPTTGTASQGFADYVPPDEFDSTLIHSRAAADLEDVLINGPGDGQDRLDWLVRHSALASWDVPITVCTVDTVLGLIQNNRAGVFSFPSIANGAFVFDEIHQYDDRLFGALLRFLDAFREVPVLLMTASLPGPRVAVLRETLQQQGASLTVVDGPPDFEALKRYRLEKSDVAPAWERVAAMVGDGGRVLWVANTVDRAVELARRAEGLGLRALPYHSRYRYQDRLKRHAAVIRAFDDDASDGVVAITTQVCESSLDLSADLLVTDLAPIPALVQRLGRLNRRATPDAPTPPALALILDPPRPEPYTRDSLHLVGRWLDRLGPAPVSQADLAAAFDALLESVAMNQQATHSAWLDGGVLAARAPLREEGATIPIVRGEDAAGLTSLRAERLHRAIIRLTIPMPLGPIAREIGSWKRVGGALVAPIGRMSYVAAYGGRWQ